jgi:hypothetical protein
MNIPPHKWINARGMQVRQFSDVSEDQRIDKPISEIVGRTIYKADPRLVKLVVEEKKKMSEEKGEHLLEQKDFRDKLRNLLR